MNTNQIKLTPEEIKADRANLIRERFLARKGNVKLTKGGAVILDSLLSDDDGEEIAGAGTTAFAGLLDLEEKGEESEGVELPQTGLDNDDESEKNTEIVSPLMREAVA